MNAKQYRLYAVQDFACKLPEQKCRRSIKDRMKVAVYVRFQGTTVKVFRNARRIIEDNPGTHYAVFVESTNKKDWKGKKVLYHIDSLNEVKLGVSDGCESVKIVII